MSLDSQITKLTQTGTITISDKLIIVCDFDADNATCRDVAALALIWAIGELQKELMKTIEQPGASKVGVI